MTRPDVAICLSRFLVANVANMFPGLPAYVVYNPVTPSKPTNLVERAAVRAEVNTPADAVVVVQAGRIEPGKGQDICLDALRLLRDLPGWECWQIGGPQKPEERRLFESLRERTIILGIAGRVRFWGWRTDVPRLLAAADVYCQPNDTFEEGLGNSFLEAMSAGLPVITSSIGAAPEVVNENCGFLLSPGDIAGVAETLKKLICDPGLRARLAAEAKLSVEARFSPSVQIRTFCEALGTAIRPSQML
jgi:glycosyltransferase involved in cell wall biosynthesis